MIHIFVLFLLLLFFIFDCCIMLGNHDPEIDAYEDAAQEAYLKDWNQRH